MSDLRLTAATSILALLLAASATAAAPKLPAGSQYVAMGSSFAAGPGIAEAAPDSPGRCGQSAENYPRQVARALSLKLVDRSCGGAVTTDILGGGPLGLAPQVEGLTGETRLVTVTIGGNDVRYMAGLTTAVCHKEPQALPEAMRERACATPATFDLDQAFATTEANLKTIAAEVRRRSPQARLIFVDYVTVLPPTGTCEGVHISAADAAELRARADRLAKLTAKVAKASGADLIKASDLTHGHDACAADPWTAGFVGTGAPGVRGRASFHPLLPAMTAIAEDIETRLR